MAKKNVIPAAEVVLLGGGHCHLEVLHQFRTLSPKPYRLTLVNEVTQVTPHAFAFEILATNTLNPQQHVDIGHLCNRSGARFIWGKATKIDPKNRLICLDNTSAPIHYDILSIDIGAKHYHLNEKIPSLKEISTPIKPLSRLLNQLAIFEERIARSTPENPFNLCVVGNDATTLEVAEALAIRFRNNLRTLKKVNIHWVELAEEKVYQLPSSLRNSIIAAVKTHGIKLHQKTALVGHDPARRCLQTAKNDIPCDALVWAGLTKGANLFAESGLQIDDSGLLVVSSNLESSSHSGVFAVGDSISFPRPFSINKASYFSQHLGSVLAANINRRFRGLPQASFRPPPQHRNLILTSIGRGLVNFGPWTFSSGYAWDNRLDTNERWMKRYQNSDNKVRIGTFIESGQLEQAPCDLAAARLPWSTQQDLERLRCERSSSESSANPDIPKTSNETGSNYSPRNYHTSFYHFRGNVSPLIVKSMCADAFDAALQHGIQGTEFHVHLATPFAPKAAMDRDAKLITHAVCDFCSDLGIQVKYVSGSSAPMTELAITVAGSSQLAAKQVLSPNLEMIITRPLGTGILAAGYIRERISSVQYWQSINETAAPHHALLELPDKLSASFHVEGHGVAGALHALSQKNDVTLEVDLPRLPIYPGVLKALTLGIRSSLHIQNRSPFTKVIQTLVKKDLLVAEALFDPQFGGPFLIFAKA